jgi:thiosulfate dehydrogenase [quinone] large subunit
MRYRSEHYVWETLRLVMGFIFLWAFFDKLFGLGFATAPEKAWLLGSSPTYGFLKFAATGAMGNFYHQLAGSQVVDWLFMLGLLGVGMALMLGVLVRLLSIVGVVMMLLMFTALSLPPTNNPLVDEHIVYAIILFGICLVRPGEWLGLGKWWRTTTLVRGYPWLE